MDDLVSVITTCYNAEKFIDVTIKSILAQDYRNFEFIIVDDGSTDNTISAVKKNNDSRICLIEAGRVGRGKALNMAIKKSKGKYIAIQDADDLSHPKRLSTEIMLLKMIGDALLGANQTVFQDNDFFDWQKIPLEISVKKNITDVTEKLVYLNPVSHTSVIIAKDILNKIGGYTETRKNLFDWDMYLKVVSKGYNVYKFSIPLVGKRLHSKQFFERKDRFSYLYGSLKLQVRAAIILKKYFFPVISIPLLFLYRILPFDLRVNARKYAKVLFFR